MISKLLIDEPPLQALPSLIKAVGTSEAIVLQQLHYHLWHSEHNEILENHFGDHWWFQRSSSEWAKKDFPCWTRENVNSLFRALQQKGFVVAFQPKPNTAPWYRIDYALLNSIFTGHAQSVNNPSHLKTVKAGSQNCEGSFTPTVKAGSQNCEGSFTPIIIRESEESGGESKNTNHSPGFDEFWTQVNRVSRGRGTKAQALSAFGRLTKSQQDRIGDRLNVWQEHWAREEYQYAPGIHRWMKRDGLCWQDPPPTARANGHRQTGHLTTEELYEANGEVVREWFAMKEQLP